MLSPIRFLFSLATTASVVAQSALPTDPSEIVPTPFEHTTFNNARVGYPFNAAGTGECRAMMAFRRSAIASETPVSVRAVRFRPFPTIFGWSGAQFRMQLTVSTATALASGAGLVNRFDDNHGTDRTVVFPLSVLTVPSPGPINVSPNPFSIEVPFTTPFQWDPRAGALLLDFRVEGIVAGSGQGIDIEGDATPKVSRLLHRSRSTATFADFSDSSAPITELVLDCGVAPTGSATSEGNSSTSLPWNAPTGQPVRVQMAYAPGSTGLSRATRITRLAWRTNAGAAWSANRSYDMCVTMSTGRANLTTSMSNSFASNHGIDRRIVFDGVWRPRQSAARPAPSPLAQMLRLQQPFDYSPETGSLVIEIQLRGSTGSSSTQFDLTSGPGVARVFQAGSSTAATGNLQSLAMPLCVSGVPQPVAPAVADRVEGNTATSLPWGATNMRAMYGYDRLAVGRNVPFNITHLSWRPDGAVADVGPTVFDVRITLSTSPLLSSALMSTAFASNHGADRTVVYDGPLTVPFERYQIQAVRPWAMTVQLDQPFHWEPRNGPLIVDMQCLRVSGRPILSDASNSSSVLGVNRVFHGSDRFAAIASTGRQGLGIVVKLGGYGANGFVEATGVGCPGQNGVPISSTIGQPWTGNSDFSIHLIDGPNSGNAALMFGAPNPVAVGLGLIGLPACTIYVDGIYQSIPTTIVLGSRRLRFPIALDPNLEGFMAGTQWSILDSTAPGGITMSNHLRFEVGH